jgi:3-dehydroquinate dehydratase-1
MVSIGNCTLGTVPRIAAIVDEFIPLAALLALPGKVDLLEMRVDRYDGPLEAIVAYLEKVRKKTGLPMLGTVRENDRTKSDRVAIFKAIMPFVDSIDIELGTQISDEVRALATGKTILVSEHDFNQTPDVAGLEDMVTRAKAQGADIVKIAAMANSRDDVIRLLEFNRACKEPLITIAMGSLGTVSRVIAPLFGSLFTYGYLTKPVAPGQLSVERLVEEFHTFFPTV